MQKKLGNPVAFLVVAAAIVGHLALIALQQFDFAPLWLAELTRFIPYYYLLVPLCLSVVAAFFVRPLAVVLAVANVLLFGIVTMDFHWRLWNDSEVAGTHVRVLTYNIKALSARHKEGGIAAIEQEVREFAPDVVALQDAQKLLPLDGDSAPTRTRPVFGLPYVYAFDQYVLASHYPLEDCKVGATNAATGDKATHYLQCSMRLDGGKQVQLVTTHFVSPRGSLLATKNELEDGVEEWQVNLARRLHQSLTLLAALSHMGRPLIVMGDLNAPEQSPVVANLKRAGLRDTFADAGKGWGLTHGHALSRNLDLYRIDHILVSGDIAVQSAEVSASTASEHNPVIADLLIQP